MKIEIDLSKKIVDRIRYRIAVISEREWSDSEVCEFIRQDVSNLYEALYEQYLDSAIMEDDEFVNNNMLPLN